MKLQFTPEQEAFRLEVRAFVQQNLPADIRLTVIGLGSNLLIRDGGLDGVVIRLSAKGFGNIEILDGHRVRAGAALPDVKPGDRLLGLYQPGAGAVFKMGGRVVGEVPDAEFSRLFFGIWLSPQTSEPGLRQQLIAMTRTAGKP